MDELAILASIQQVLEEHYAQGDCSLHSLNTRSLDDDRIVYKMYRVDAPGSPSWIVFAAHDDLIAGRTFRWETFLSPKLWQEQRATLLTILADNHYPAPRVIPSLCGNLVTSQGPWHLLVTTFLDGQAGGVSSEHLARLAGALGRLHSLPFPKDLPVGFSRWNRAYSIPHALELLERVKADVPISHSILYHQCEQILQTVGTYLESAPHVLVHGDCWPPNSVRTGQQDVALIDWEGAGKGASILDFGSLTLTCQYDQYGGMPNTGDPQRVATVVTPTFPCVESPCGFFIPYEDTPFLLANNYFLHPKWVADVTYIATAAGWMYLAAVLDFFSRRIVGWAMAPHEMRSWWSRRWVWLSLIASPKPAYSTTLIAVASTPTKPIGAF